MFTKLEGELCELLFLLVLDIDAGELMYFSAEGEEGPQNPEEQHLHMGLLSHRPSQLIYHISQESFLASDLISINLSIKPREAGFSS